MEEDELSIQGQVTIFKEKYKNEIKPLIEKEYYYAAGMELSNIVFMMDMNCRKIGLDIHCGIRYMASAKLLRDKLLEEIPDKEDIKSYVERFEAYQAQTKLPNRLNL